MSSEARKQRFRDAASRRQSTISVLLENVEDPHNISAVMRTADSIGCKEIFVLNNKIPSHKRWGFRSSGGAHKWVLVHQFTDLHQCVSAIKLKYDFIVGTHLNAAAVSLYELDFTTKIVLAFGNEANGLSTELLELCHQNFVIPQLGLSQSLNISVACAVSLYEGYRQKRKAGHYGDVQLSSAEMQELIDYWNSNDNRLKL
jgi:tRNA (guanosine-2'-O-)-methyltransferase